MDMERTARSQARARIQMVLEMREFQLIRDIGFRIQDSGFRIQG